MNFNRKGYGRIYTDKKENIPLIENIIHFLDELEFPYLPDGLITVYGGKIEHIYNHKFDSLDMDDVMRECWNKGIFAFYTVK